MEISIRKVNTSDMENLKRFFIKAYGQKTVFQNEQFLMYYFDSRNKKVAPMNACFIGLSPDGEIVSHYGGLHYELKMNNIISRMIWGVNAYTLPEWRGKGINSKMVNFLIENNEINGVIGFTEKITSFYQKLGYNMFDFERFTRYVQILDYDKTQEVISFIQQDGDRLNEQTQIQTVNITSPDFENVVELTKNNIKYFELKLDKDLSGIATTHRSKEFLNWRLLKNPFIKYTVYGFLKNGKIVTFIALREEKLAPYNFQVNRIIDLYGNKEGISALLNKAIQESILKNHIYIDFSMFGAIYEKELVSSNFIRLENEDYSILPQVTAPIENRLNHEFIGIQSQKHSKVVENFSKDNVYFTRIDSDRDRLG